MWNRIRTLGELQILTRASYVMLIFVPLLAGVWPAVGEGINRYNTSVIESKAALDSASQRLEFVASTLTNESDVSLPVGEIFDGLNKRLDNIDEEYSLKTIDNTRLPYVWALSFLASLAVAIGHLIYQAFAPALVKRTTVREYMNDEVRRFSDAPSAGSLERARHFLSSAEHKSVTRQGVHSEADSLRDKRTQREKLEKGIRNLEVEKHNMDPALHSSEIQQIDNDLWKRKAELANLEDPDDRRLELAVIEAGAESEYIITANTMPLAAIASGIFYAIGLILVVSIIVTQTINVVSATLGA